MTATAEPPSTEPPLDDAWCVLSSGALAYRQPPTKAGRPVWLDALRCVRLCEHGHSATQIHHWRCAARPRVKPEWIACNCANARGLCMDAKETPLEMPADVPPYHAVLWRDAQPTLLEPNGVWAVKVPGKPKGHEVFLDGGGTPHCAHGFNASLLRACRTRERAGAAAQLQAWWRVLDHTARASVRSELLRQQRGASPSFASSFEQADLRRAAAVWREAPHRANRPRPCRCTTKGLRLERFGSKHRHWPSQQRKRKADAGDAALLDLVDFVGHANRRVAR